MRFLILFILIALFGCMTQDPGGPGGKSDTIKIQDQNLLAGATSSTNWPGEDAGSKFPHIKGESDTSLVFKFFDTTGSSMSVSGSLELILSGSIPALDSSPSVTLPILNQTEITIPASTLLSGFKDDGRDSVVFSALFEIGSRKCFMPRFVLSREHKKFILSPFSVDPDYSGVLSDPHYSFHGIPDAGLPYAYDFGSVKKKWCFYIPGSPFFFKTVPDTAISIGPLPLGDFPIRILRVVPDSLSKDSSRLEVFEVKLELGAIDSTHHDSYWVVKAGKRIFETSYKTADLLKSGSPILD